MNDSNNKKKPLKVNVYREARIIVSDGYRPFDLTLHVQERGDDDFQEVDGDKPGCLLELGGYGENWDTEATVRRWLTKEELTTIADALVNAISAIESLERCQQAEREEAQEEAEQK